MQRTRVRFADKRENPNPEMDGRARTTAIPFPPVENGTGTLPTCEQRRRKTDFSQRENPGTRSRAPRALGHLRNST